LHDGGVVGVRVADMASPGERRDDDQRNARAIAEEVQRDHGAGVPVTAAFVKGDDERRLFEELWMRLEPAENAVNDRFQYVQLGTRRMAVSEAVWLQVRHRGQMAVA